MKCRTHIFLFSIFFFILLHEANAQKSPTEKKDSARLYERIQDFSNKRKVTQLLYVLVFRPIQKEEKEKPVKTEVKQIYYEDFEGKVIRNIYIETHDPFGFDSKDTTRIADRGIQKAGNYLHVKSWPIIIRNLLIIKEYDTFDSLRVRESERLIRSQNYVREVVFYPVLTGAGDSVDIDIRVYDLFSIVGTGTASKSAFSIHLKDKNFLGFGHQLENTYHLDHTSGHYSNSTNYYLSNIQDTYVNATLRYDTDDRKNYIEGCNVERPFYSVFTQFAGGVSFYQYLNRAELVLADSSRMLQTYKNNTQDYWIGKSWQLFKGHSENERTTDFILTGRYFRNHYVEKPPTFIDTSDSYATENFYLLGAGLSQRKSKQDSYIFKYGYVEDVPLGRVLSVVAGYQIKGKVARWYVGPRLYWGKYYNWGYFSTNLEYGTFIRKNALEQGSFSGGVNYFSPILNLGRWKLRQFVKSQFTQGFERTEADNLSLNSDAGIRGFNSTGLTGTQKLVLVLQTQSYAPWNLVGFRFGPYFVCSLGVLGKESSGFHKSPVYSLFGFGLLLKNEFLVISSFEISIAYFPVIPGVGNNIIKPNPFKTTDFGFRDASIGKPSTVPYQ